MNQSTEQRARSDARYNYFAASMDAGGFPVGNTFIALMTVMPAFLSELTKSKVAIGGILSLYLVGVSLPPLFAANFIQRMPVKRDFVFWVAVVERLAILGLAIAAAVLGRKHPEALLLLTFILLGVNFCLMGVNYASYSAMIAKIIPTNRRGALFGWAGAIAGALSIGASWVLAVLLRRYGFPQGYAYAFIIGFVILMLSIIPIAFIREPEESTEQLTQSWGEYWRSLWGILQRDRNFARFIGSQMLMGFSAMAAAFFTLYAIEHFGIGKGMIAFYTGVLAATSVVASALWGVIIDRCGNKLVVGCGAISAAMACFAAIWAPNPAVYTLVFVLSTFSGYALGIAGFNIVLEFCEPADSPRYMALSAAVPAPFRGLAPMLGALVAREFGFVPVFALTAMLMVAGVIVLLGVHEPRHLENVPVMVER